MVATASWLVATPEENCSANDAATWVEVGASTSPTTSMVTGWLESTAWPSPAGTKKYASMSPALDGGIGTVPVGERLQCQDVLGLCPFQGRGQGTRDLGAVGVDHAEHEVDARAAECTPEDELKMKARASGAKMARMNTDRSRTRSLRSLTAMRRAAATSVPQRLPGEMEEHRLQVGLDDGDSRDRPPGC